jgi:hypothetical protein
MARDASRAALASVAASLTDETLGDRLASVAEAPRGWSAEEREAFMREASVRLRGRVTKDARALDEIADVLTNERWDAAAVTVVAEWVRTTGRPVAEVAGPERGEGSRG